MDLGWYDYGARFYDPQLGRFHTTDPHSEYYLSWTPYNYVANNPILLIDPNGMDWYTNEGNGNLIWYNNDYMDDEDFEVDEGYTFLGEDDFFGEDATGQIDEFMDSHIDDFDAEGMLSFSMPTDLSEQFAGEAGFKKAVSEEQVEITELTTYYTNERGQNEATLYPPQDVESLSKSYTYIEKGKSVQNTQRDYLFNVRRKHEGSYMIERNVENWRYDYNKRDNSAKRDKAIIFAIELINDILSLMK